MLSAMAMVAALTAFLAFAPFASAASDPLASGTTKIILNSGFSNTLKKSDVKLLKISPATVKKQTVTLSVTEGEIDPLTGQGTMTLSGGFKFKHGKKSAPVKALVLNTTSKSLSGKVAGTKMKIASVSGISVARNGFGANVAVKKLKLTSKAAKQLNKKLGFGGKEKKKHKRAAASSKDKSSSGSKAPFKGGQLMGSSASETQPKTVTVLPGNKANLVTNLATVKKFTTEIGKGGLGVAIEAISPGELEIALPPVLKFPILGGSIAPDATSGIVQTGGGVKLHQALGGGLETNMLLNAIWVDLGAHTATVEVTVESNVDPKLNLGFIGRSSIADVSLVGATVKSVAATHTVTVENATATLQAVTAETLNSVFGAPLEAKKIPFEKFAPGDGLGIFSFTVQTQ